MAALALAGPGVAVGGEPDSGIRGRVVYGPVAECAVRDGQEDCYRPYEATIRIRRSRHGRVIRRVQSNAKGRFRVELAPGRYVLDPVNHGRFPHADRKTVHVACGRYTRVRIQYNSGIR